MEYSQLGHMLEYHYILRLLLLRFFHVYNVCGVWLLTSQMLALCSS